jgi:hypothetical protein
MSKDKYVFVMRDHGQDICDECLLRGDDDLEPWENFVNGEMTTDAPTIPGFYPTLVRFRGEIVRKTLEARPAANKKGACVWAQEKMRGKVAQRWTLPYPWPAIWGPGGQVVCDFDVEESDG